LEFSGGPYDFVICYGLLNVFNDAEQLLERLIANTKPGGVILVQSLFNDDDIDVRLEWRANNEIEKIGHGTVDSIFSLPQGSADGSGPNNESPFSLFRDAYRPSEKTRIAL